MAKLTEYPQATKFDQGDILIKDGINGTKKILVSDAAKVMGSEVIMVNEDAGENTKVVVTTTDEEYELALMSDLAELEGDLSDVDDDVEGLKTQVNDIESEINADVSFDLTHMETADWVTGSISPTDGSTAHSDYRIRHSYITPIAPGTKIRFTGTSYDSVNNCPFLCFVHEYKSGYTTAPTSITSISKWIIGTDILSEPDMTLTVGDETAGICVVFGRDRSYNILASTSEISNIAFATPESIVTSNIADDYDATATYSVGDYRVFNNILYKCIDDIDTPEAWNAAHWTRATVGEEITALKNSTAAEIDSLENDIDGIKSEIVKETPFVVTNDSWEIGKAIGATGGTSTSSSYAYTTYIMPCAPGTTFKYTGTTFDNINNCDFICYLHEYSKDSGGPGNSQSNWLKRTNIITENGLKVTTGDSTLGVAISFGRASSTGVTFVEADLQNFSMVSVEEIITKAQEEIDNIVIPKNSFVTGNMTGSGSISIEDGVTVSAGGVHTNEALTVGGKWLSVSLKDTVTIPSSQIITVLFYDGTDQYIGYTTHALNARQFYIGIPDGCAKINVNCNYSNPSSDMFAFSWDKWEEYTAYNGDTNTDSSKLPPVHNKLKFKKIVNFGDSIFGLRRPPNSLSDWISLYTGAKCYNIGFGGCNMASKSDSKYDPFCMYRLADAIADNDFTLQEAQVSATGVPSYFSDALTLLESIDFSTVDIITIAYGTNDFSEFTLLDNAENLYDTDTFAGALRYSIETILTAFPKIKVFVLTPIWRFWLNSENEFLYDSNSYERTKIVDGQPYTDHIKLTDFVEKAIETANEYQLDYIDDFYNTGMNKFNRSVYFPSNDGTHPNLVGLQMLGRHIAHHLY